MKTVFEYKDYRALIKDQIRANKDIRGYQGQLAGVARCKESYFSNVINDKASLGPEQAMRLAIYWNFGGLETQYFSDLVTLDRVGFMPLRKMILERMKKLRQESQHLSKRFKEATTFDAEAANLYYSQWIYGAVHILVGIPGYQSPKALARRLLLPEPVVEKCLHQLLDMGLVECRSGRWAIVPGHVHLPGDHPMVATHHQNWRTRAVLDSQSFQQESLHYTSVQSLSFEDYLQTKQVFLDAVDQSRQLMRDSKDEELACLCIDVFRV